MDVKCEWNSHIVPMDVVGICYEGVEKHIMLMNDEMVLKYQEMRVL